MKRTIRYAFALATQLPFINPSYAVAPRDVITQLGGETCLKTFKDGEAYEICDGSELSSGDRAIFNTAIERRQDNASVPKPDPRTPRYNKCVVDNYENYYFIRDHCGTELNADLDAAFGTWWNQDKRRAVYMQTKKREAEMKRTVDEGLRKLENDREASRRKMTPLERRIDELEEKVNAPCIYYDEMNIARSCN